MATRRAPKRPRPEEDAKYDVAASSVAAAMGQGRRKRRALDDITNVRAEAMPTAGAEPCHVVKSRLGENQDVENAGLTCAPARVGAVESARVCSSGSVAACSASSSSAKDSFIDIGKSSSGLPSGVVEEAGSSVAVAVGVSPMAASDADPGALVISSGGGCASPLASSSSSSSSPPGPVTPSPLEPFVKTYMSSVLKTCMETEVATSPLSTYMSLQRHINSRMRAILVDWLVEVQCNEAYDLLPETLFLTVNIFDRYLSVRPDVERQRLQLVGAAAMLTSFKFCEAWPRDLSVKQVVEVTDRTYERAEVLEMEADLLNALSFRLAVPTAYTFITWFLQQAGFTETDAVGRISMYILELALLDYDYLQYSASRSAAAALCVAMQRERRLSSSAEWDAQLAAATKYNYSKLADLCGSYCTLLREPVVMVSARTSLQAVVRKYSRPEYGAVATRTYGADCVTFST